jgi:hypothetical protein
MLGIGETGCCLMANLHAHSSCSWWWLLRVCCCNYHVIGAFKSFINSCENSKQLLRWESEVKMREIRAPSPTRPATHNQIKIKENSLSRGNGNFNWTDTRERINLPLIVSTPLWVLACLFAMTAPRFAHFGNFLCPSDLWTTFSLIEVKTSVIFDIFSQNW